jgi:Holliday junction resolvase RusA-like endonuclease
MTGSARKPSRALVDLAARVVAAEEAGEPWREPWPRLDIHIPGPLVPWQRTATVGGKRITPASQRAYQRHVEVCALVARHRSPGWPRGARYSVDIVWTPQDRRRRDIDNAAKTVLDALNGVAWDDDSQVDRLCVQRMPPSKTAEVFVAVSLLRK